MRVDPVTARYAEALFELARDKGVLDGVQRDVEFLGEQLAADGVSAWLFDAGVPDGDKRARLAKLEPHLNEWTARFVRLLVDKRRLEVLRELPAAFRQRMLVERGAVEGVVETARPLGDAELAEIAAKLGSLLKKEVVLETRLEPDLVAGVRVRVANRMFDSSAAGRLEGLRERLTAVSLDPV